MTAVSPTAARKSSRPTQGHPPGNVEKNLCSPRLLDIRSCASSAPIGESNGLHRKVNPRNSESFHTTFVALPGARRILFFSQLDDSSADGDRHGLRAITGVQLLHDVLDVNLDGLL